MSISQSLMTPAHVNTFLTGSQQSLQGLDGESCASSPESLGHMTHISVTDSEVDPQTELGMHSCISFFFTNTLLYQTT